MACKMITLDSTNCVIKNGQFGFYINEERLEDILKNQCEGGLDEDKKYFASVHIEISAIEEEPLRIEKSWENKKQQWKGFELTVEDIKF